MWRSLALVALAQLSADGCRGKTGSSCDDILDCPDEHGCYRGKCTPVSPIGGPCDEPAQLFCTGHDLCIDGVCRAHAKRGERCTKELLCEKDFGCLDGACVPQAELDAANKLAKEREMLAQSGAGPPSAEKVAAAPARGAGQPVRVVEVKEKGYALAACRADERLIGGECDGSAYSSRPANFGPTDTVGARWECKGAPDVEVTAFALCASLPEAKP